MNLMNKLKILAASCLVGILGCAGLNNPANEEIDKSMQTYAERSRIRIEKEKLERHVQIKRAVSEEARELRSYVFIALREEIKNEDFNLDLRKHEHYSVLGIRKRKPESLVEHLTPDDFYASLIIPKYGTKYEKRELRFWNRIAKTAGLGKIKGFVNRNPVENAFLEVGGDYSFSRLDKLTGLFGKELAERLFLGLKIRYGKDTVENDLSGIKVDIADKFCGAGFDMTFYPDIKSDFLFPIKAGVDYNVLDVDVTFPGFDSRAKGLGYHASIGLETKPNAKTGILKLLPKNISLFFSIGGRYEELHGNRNADNRGIEACIGIKKWWK